MQIIEKTIDLEQIVSTYRSQGKSIALVPTMGALHAGHLSLVKQAKKDCDICIISVFVNPTQFNNKEDLEKYPRDIDRDVQLLKDDGVDVIFAPTVEEVYPKPDTRQFDFGELDKVMEGKYRSGHFNGVAQVVSRLFYMAQPDKAYFGEKDFQQLAIIREMVKQLSLQVQIVPMPILREASGLALSSRNERLTENQKILSANIYKALSFSKNNYFDKISVEDTVQQVVEEINRVDELEVEYFEIVDGFSLQPIKKWSDSEYIVGCITVYCGDVRLIDNITYKELI